ncbi:MAG TPA: hypothetical protein VFC85_09235, partial [Verrucomicrobiae bacterium]|nr:hypothetical protein [Verrucomicrobiae bacterium]
GVRIVALSLVFAVSFGILKFDFSHQPVAREFLKAAYIFSIYVIGMGLFAYSSRRRQQIQIEEKTFAEAEWTIPRKDTDHAANPRETELNFNLKAVKFKAFILVLSAIMLFQAPWKQHLGYAILLSAGFVLCLIWSFHLWQNRPRYLSLRSSWVLGSPIFIGLVTLFSFNFHQYQAQAGSGASTIASPTEVFTFNLVVALAYAAFVGILVWTRKATILSMPLK